MASFMRLVLHVVTRHTKQWQIWISENEINELHDPALKLLYLCYVWLHDVRFGTVEISHEKQSNFMIRYHHLMASRTPVSRPRYRYRAIDTGLKPPLDRVVDLYF